MGSSDVVPSSVFNHGYTPFTDKMVRVVVRRLKNRVDRVEWHAYEARPPNFPAGSVSLEVRGDWWEVLQHSALATGGFVFSDDAVLVGCRYEDDGLLHLCMWSCVDPLAPGVPPILWEPSISRTKDMSSSS